MRTSPQALGLWRSCALALACRDRTAALGFVNAMSDLPQAANSGGVRSVLALP